MCGPDNGCQCRACDEITKNPNAQHGMSFMIEFILLNSLFYLAELSRSFQLSLSYFSLKCLCTINSHLLPFDHHFTVHSLVCMLGNLLTVMDSAKDLAQSESFQRLIRQTLELVGSQGWANPDFRKCACFANWDSFEARQHPGINFHDFSLLMNVESVVRRCVSAAIGENDCKFDSIKDVLLSLLVSRVHFQSDKECDAGKTACRHYLVRAMIDFLQGDRA